MNIPEKFVRKTDGSIVFQACKDSNDYAGKSEALAAAPTPPAQELPPNVINALRFYANGEHFNIDGDAQEFDTVSGEPDNWLHSQQDNDCTMIEDGSIARAVLQGKKIHGELDSKPVESEVFGILPAPEVERQITAESARSAKRIETRPDTLSHATRR